MTTPDTAFAKPARDADAALPARQAAGTLPEGFRLEDYRIDAVLGQGPFGITYRATDVHLSAPVAIKEYLPADIAFRQADSTVSPSASRLRDAYLRGMEAFLVEARTLASLRHPAVVRVLRFFEANRTAYMVLEFEAGTPFRHWWPQHQALGEDGLVDRLAPVLDGIAVLHASGVLHRDIKPDNLQVRDEDGRFVLLDFRPPGHVAPSAGYAAPELHDGGPQSPATDLYGIGATLYWAVSGKKPPDGPSRRSDPTPMRSAMDCGRGRYGESFLRAIDTALRLDPAKRPRDVLELRRLLFADHLDRLDNHGVGADGDTVIEGDRPLPRPRLRGGLRQALHPATWPLATKLVLAVVAAVVLPLAAALAYVFAGGQAALARAESRFVEQVAQGSAGRLAQFVADARQLGRSLASDHDLIVFLATPDETGRLMLQDKFGRLVQAQPQVLTVTLLDTRGTAVVASDAAGAGARFEPDAVLQRALAGGSASTGLVPQSGSTVSSLTFVERVAGDDGRVLGAVALRVRGTAVAAIVDEARRDPALTPFLVDGRGMLLLHPARERITQPLATLEPDLAAALKGVKAPGHVDDVALPAGGRAIAGYAPVAGTDWVLGISDARGTAESPLARAARHVVWAALLLAVLAGAAAWHFARGLVRPVQDLTRASDALKAGDFHNATVPVQRRDELGQLARTFNVMIDVLRQRERERERKK